MSALVNHRGPALAARGLMLLDVVNQALDPGAVTVPDTTTAGARASGDLLVVLRRYVDLDGGDSNWTKTADDGARDTVWSRTATGTSADNFVSSADGFRASTWTSFRVPSSPTATWGTPVSGTTLSFPSLTAPGLGLDVIIGQLSGTTTGTMSTPSGFTLQREDTYSTLVRSWVFTRPITSTGATGSASSTTSTPTTATRFLVTL